MFLSQTETRTDFEILGMKGKIWSPGRINLSSGEVMEKLLDFVSEKMDKPCSIVVETSCYVCMIWEAVFYFLITDSFNLFRKQLQIMK